MSRPNLREFSSIVEYEIQTKGGNVILAGQDPADVIADLEKMYAVEKPFADLRGAEYLNDADQVRLLKIEAELPELFTRALDALGALVRYHLIRLWSYSPKMSSGPRGRQKKTAAIEWLGRAYSWVQFAKAASLPARRFNECFIAVDAVVATYHHHRNLLKPLFQHFRDSRLEQRSAADASREVVAWCQTRRNEGIALTGNKKGVCAI